MTMVQTRNPNRRKRKNPKRNLLTMKNQKKLFSFRKKLLMMMLSRQMTAKGKKQHVVGQLDTIN